MQLAVSIPEINNFNVNTGKTKINRVGFLGFGVGLNYYYSKQSIISFRTGVNTDFIAPLPLPFGRIGFVSRNFGTFALLQNQHIFNKFKLGYGVHMYKNKYTESDGQGLPGRIDYQYAQYNVGPSASIYATIYKGIELGVQYLPAVYSWQNSLGAFGYNHLLYLDIASNIDLYRKSNKQNNFVFP